MGEAGKEEEEEKGLLLLKSLAEALSGGVSAVLASVRTELAPSGALVRSHSKVVSSAFLLSVSMFLPSVCGYSVRPPCNHFNDFPCGIINIQFQVSPVPSACSLFMVQREASRSALAPVWWWHLCERPAAWLCVWWVPAAAGVHSEAMGGPRLQALSQPL